MAVLLAGLSLHELGHVLAVWMTGGRITEWVVFSLTPHVRTAGSCGNSQEAFRAAAGSALVLLLVFAFLPWRPVRGYVWQFVQDIAFWFAMVEVAGWVLCSLFPRESGPNDAARFLEVSGMSRFAVAGVCAAVGSIAVLCLRLGFREQKV